MKAKDVQYGQQFIVDRHTGNICIRVLMDSDELVYYIDLSNPSMILSIDKQEDVWA